MPFSSVSHTHTFVGRVRRHPIAAYGIVLGVVALATSLRLAFDAELLSGLPFITYYPAVIVAALIGGFGPGLVAIVLGALLAWFFFLPAHDGWQLDAQVAFTLLLFIAFSGLNVFIIWFLDRMLDRVIAQEQNVRMLIEIAPNGIVVVDEQGRIKLVNAGAERLFGYWRDELLGKSIEVLVPAPQAEAHRSLRAAYQERPETRPIGAGRDLSGRRKDGSEFPVEIGLNPVAADGRRAVLATVIDISMRKRVHESQRLLIRELQHRTRNLFAVIRSISDNTLFTGRPLAEARYVFVWRETGGPTVSPPANREFGSVILEEAARLFANSVTMTFAPEGLMYELRLNLDEIQAGVRPAQ